MSKLNPIKGALLFTMFCGASSAIALENLDDSAMSDVVAQDGVRLISEFDMEIQEVSLRDTDDKGRISISGIHYRTAANRQQDIDFRVASEEQAFQDLHGTGATCPVNVCSGKLGLVFYNRDLPYEMSIEQIKINDKSVGKLSTYGFEINAFADRLTDHTSAAGSYRNLTSFSVAAYAGGKTGRGLTFDMRMPITAQYSTEYEEDGIKLKSTVRHVDVLQLPEGSLSLLQLARLAEKGDMSDGTPSEELNYGLNFENLTIDGHAEGLMVGLPTINDGMIAFTDFEIGNDEVGYDKINDVILKDINFLPDSYILLKPGLTATEDEVGFDLGISKGTNLTYVYRDDKDQVSARITLEGNSGTGIYGLTTTGAAINNGDGSVIRNAGTADEFAVNGMRVNLGALKGRIKIDEVRISPNYSYDNAGVATYIKDADRITSPPLGEITLNLNLANTSYVEIRGN